MYNIDNNIPGWQDYVLNIDSDRGPLTVKWNQSDKLAFWANIQAGVYLQKTNSLQTFYEFFPRWYQLFWDRRFAQGLFDVADDSVILDIGCGIAVIDLLLASYLPRSKFYLLDQQGYNFTTGIYYDDNYPVYHNWDPVIDAISASGLDHNRFVFLEPENTWPDQVDVITSYFSYCFHYPKEKYWDNILASLKIGGKLILDVRQLSDRDTIGEISEAMKSTPTCHWFDSKLPEHVDNMPAPIPGMPMGGRCMWTRNK